MARGLSVTQVEQLPEVLPTVDPELGRLVHTQLVDHGVDVLCRTAVTRIGPAPAHASGRLQVDGVGPDGALTRFADIVLVVVGVRPDTSLAVEAGANIGAKGAIAVDRHMRTNLPDVFAAGDCVVTYHRLLGETYLPLGTTAHKQGRVAGEKRSAVIGSSPGASGPRWSRSLTPWRPGPACAIMRPSPPGSTR